MKINKKFQKKEE